MAREAVFSTFKVFDIDITFEYRPSDDLYRVIVPKTISVSLFVVDNFNKLSLDEQKSMLKAIVIEQLEEEVMFDTPDAPDFAISDVDFCFEEAE